MSSANVVLIGESGNGKTTLINYCENYCRKNSIDRLSFPARNEAVMSYQNVRAARNLSPSTSKFIDHAHGRDYIFLDTPGFLDANDEEENQIITNNIIKAILDLGTLNNVIFVINGSNNHLSPTSRFVLKFLHNYFSDEILSKLIVVFTHVQQHQSSFDLNLLNFPKKIHVFYMQNSIFAGDSRTWSNEKRHEIQKDFQNSLNQIKSMFNVIDQSQRQLTEVFHKVRQMRSEIQQSFHLLRLPIISLSKMNSDSSGGTSLIETFECLPSSHVNTICANCNLVCYGIDRQINGRCSKCPGKCLQKHHYTTAETLQSKFQSSHSVFADFIERFSLRLSLSRFSIDQNHVEIVLAKILQCQCEEIHKKLLQLTKVCSLCDLDDEIDNFHRQMAKAGLQSHPMSEKLERVFNELTRNQEANRQEQIHREVLFPTEKVQRKSIDYKQLKMEELVEMVSNSADRSINWSVFTEIFQRIQGHSFYQTVNGESLRKINEYFEKFKKKDLTQLIYARHRYQRRISEILENDLRNILQIPEELLFENYIVSTLLKEKEDNTDVRDVRSQPCHIGFPQLSPSPVPYPATDAMPSAPNHPNYSLTTNAPWQASDQQQYSMSSNYPALIQSFPIPQPPINNLIYPGAFSVVTSETSGENGSTSIADNPLKFFSNQELLSMHFEAVRSSNSAEENRIHAELTQRCFGDHPLLISGNREKFNELFRKHQHKGFNQLSEEKNFVRAAIERFLVDGDVRRIDLIPVDLILEAAVLKQLISSRI